MKFEMSEKDKKLVFILTLVVIVVAIGYWGIYPNIKKAKTISKQITEEQKTKESIETKINLLAILDKDNSDLEEKITNIRSEFSEKLESDLVDKKFTEEALEHNLKIYQLDIEMPKDETDIEPYKYSQKAYDEANAAEEETSDLGLSSSDYSDSTYLDTLYSATQNSADFTDSSAPKSSIYAVPVSLLLGGSEDDLKDIIEYYANTDEKIRLVSYKWKDSRETSKDESGYYEVNMVRQLDLKLELYMTAE